MDNSQKLWFQDSLNRVAIKSAAIAIEQQGRALPCRVVAVHGSIVTVAFEVLAGSASLPQITIPKNESRWMRSPTQIGDFGVTEPADVYLGGISGQGGGTANLSQRGNLTALMFTPCASSAFPAVNVNAAYIAGPEGALIETEDHSGSVNVQKSSVTITALSNVVINAPGVSTSGNFAAGNGITCTFTTSTGQTVTVQNGIITNLH